MFYFLNSQSNLFDDFCNDFFSKPTYSEKSNTNIEKTEKEFILTTQLPGFKKEEIQISIENNILKITAKRNKKINWLKEEYERSYTIDNIINTDNIDAKLEDGILTINLPLKEQAKPKTITIK